MSTYVLIHGGWVGGWIWTGVSRLLRSRGHEVYAPTLTGLGERRHLLSPDIGLDTHVQDVLGVLEYEDLADVLLVGYSYGGAVAASVADRAPERISRVVYLDAIVPKDGESVMMAIDPAIVPIMEELVRTVGEGWLVPASPPDIPEAIKFGPQPWRTYIDPLRTQNSAALTLPRTYVWCTAKPTSGDIALLATYRSMARARAEGWGYYEIATGHTPMYEKPDDLADILIEVAGG